MSHPNRKSDLGKALLRAHYGSREQAYRIIDDDGEESSVYLLNRLDSATSGIVLLSISESIMESVKRSFEEQQVEKVYQALVFGTPRKGSPVWKDKLSVSQSGKQVRARSGGSLMAETRLLKSKPIPGPPLMSLLSLQPLTGRTHQLRIQTSKRGLPIVGDRTYGDFKKNKLAAQAKGIKRLCLHCERVKLKYQYSGKWHHFEAYSKSPFL